MNVNEYIASGILEAYVAGQVTDQERQEVQCLSKIYPEIKAELEELELGMEAFAMSHSMAPPPELKSAVMDAIDALPTEEEQENKVVHFTAPESEHEEHLDLEPREVAVGMQKGAWGAIAAIAVILFAVNIYNQIQLANQRNQIEHLAETTKRYEREVDELDRAYALKDEQLATIRDASTSKIGLGNTPNYADAAAAIFWNKDEGTVIIDGARLPELSDQEQYQLWALIDGQPVSLGLLPQGAQRNVLQQMKNTGQADAFAITIEPKGGRTVPTLEKMVVYGETA